MAIAKVCGIETEYGIVTRGGDAVPTSNPTAASSMLINAYIGATAPERVRFDLEDESPANDARGFSLDEGLLPEFESTLVNTVLPNGARYYVDHAHPEISLPEVTTAAEAVQWDAAADLIVQESMVQANEILANSPGFDRGSEIVIYKNNSDGKGNSYGCHENYLMSRQLPFGRIVSGITPHFVTRQIFCGAGKVGTEQPNRDPGDIAFQLSQRADFFEEEVGLETTLKRPIINTRDEPHCDATKYRRLHVIVGDANMSQVATYLKVGTTAILLAMLEDDALGDSWLLGNPVPAIRQVSHDPTLTATVMLRSGARATALEIQWGLYELARKYENTHGLAAVGEAVGADVLARWETVLTGLERDPDTMGHWVDWVAKRRLVTGYAQRHQLAATSPKLKAIDLQYHDMRPARCLATRAGLDTLVSPSEAEWAMTQPPTTTRAYFRGRCLQKFPDQIVAANWDSLVFDVGRDPLRRVPMMEPLRGTADHVAKLIDSSDTAAELVRRLSE